jgi:hypothetical protein
MSEKISVSVPELVAIAATRGMIGVGAGLLLSNLVPGEKRRAIGIPLFALGLLSTIPIAKRIFHKEKPADEHAHKTPDRKGN